MAVLAPFYRDWTWTGTIEANGMGPGSPEMSGVGRATCRLAEDGLWYVCDFEQDQRLADGTFVLRWQLHWVTGWDAPHAEYRASSADNNGPNLAIYRGRIDGSRLVYESLEDGYPRIRLTWILDNKFGFDKLWINGFAGGGVQLGKASRAIDTYVVDGAVVNGSARVVELAANLLRRTQSGFLYHYAFAMIIGLIALLAVLMHSWR